MSSVNHERRKKRLQADLRRGGFLAGSAPRRVSRETFKPSLESLEARQLMAADLALDSTATVSSAAVSSDVTAMMPPAPRHNSIDPEDVDDDGQCAPSDALAVINAVNVRSTDAAHFIDVNGDG